MQLGLKKFSKIIPYMLFIGLTLVFSKPTATPNEQKQNQAMRTLHRLDNLTFSFDCSKKAVGFYADLEYNCQIFHMCTENGKRVPHACANDTTFNQEFRICDWEYNFNCSDAPKWYYLNELTYATNSPEIIDEINMTTAV